MTDEATDKAASLVEAFEGFSSAPYCDPVGVWTIGYGSTRDVNLKRVSPATAPITKEQAGDLVKRDLLGAAVAVGNLVHEPITDDQKGALYDFVYNVGEGNFSASTLLRKLNAGDYEGAGAELLKWDMAKGQHLAGLLRRRQAELGLFS